MTVNWILHYLVLHSLNSQIQVPSIFFFSRSSFFFRFVPTRFGSVPNKIFVAFNAREYHFNNFTKWSYPWRKVQGSTVNAKGREEKKVKIYNSNSRYSRNKKFTFIMQIDIKWCRKKIHFCRRIFISFFSSFFSLAMKLSLGSFPNWRGFWRNLKMMPCGIFFVKYYFRTHPCFIKKVYLPNKGS